MKRTIFFGMAAAFFLGALATTPLTGQERTSKAKKDDDFPYARAANGAEAPKTVKAKADASATETSQSRTATDKSNPTTSPASRRAARANLLRSSQILGMPVQDNEDQVVGKIVDLVGDTNGQNQFVVISLKGDERMIVLPFQGLQFDPGKGKNVLARLRIKPAKLKNAPSFVGSEWPTFDQKFSGWVSEFYSDLLVPTRGQDGEQRDVTRVSALEDVYPNPVPKHASPGSEESQTPNPSASDAARASRESQNRTPGRPSDREPGGFLPNPQEQPRLPGSTAPGSTGATSGAPAPGGSGAGGAVPGGSGGAPGAGGTGGASGGGSGSGGSSGSGSSGS
jgi:hypothetical protein